MKFLEDSHIYFLVCYLQSSLIFSALSSFTLTLLLNCSCLNICLFCLLPLHYSPLMPSISLSSSSVLFPLMLNKRALDQPAYPEQCAHVLPLAAKATLGLLSFLVLAFPSLSCRLCDVDLQLLQLLLLSVHHQLPTSSSPQECHLLSEHPIAKWLFLQCILPQDFQP